MGCTVKGRAGKTKAAVLRAPSCRIAARGVGPPPPRASPGRGSPSLPGDPCARFWSWRWARQAPPPVGGTDFTAASRGVPLWFKTR